MSPHLKPNDVSDAIGIINHKLIPLLPIELRWKN